MKTVSILGSTGSIGTQALEVCQEHNINILALCAKTNVELISKQARKFKPEFVCIEDKSYYTQLKTLLADTDVKVLTGMDCICEIAANEKNDIVLNAIVGINGLLPTISTINANNILALANKESLVTGGEYVKKLLKKSGNKILPVDSEHSAIFQCLQEAIVSDNNYKNILNKIILTASGGPFFGKTYENLKNVTVSDALNHPNWSMGAKITIDSASLMNKGLEIIEAVLLFDISEKDIEVVVHRESIIHSAVEFVDHSVIAQMGVPDMKIPIQYALTYPDRKKCNVKSLSLTDIGSLSFAKPDEQTFSCLHACKKAVAIGGTAPCIVNGANEAAVDLFLKEKIKFLEIGELVNKALTSINPIFNYSLDDILQTDILSREFVYSQL